MTVEVRMPQISMTMIDGTIVKWLKTVGDPIAEGESLVEIQTDKVVEELGAAVTGVVQSIAAPEGEVVPVGDLICIIADAAEASSREQPSAAPQVVRTAPDEPDRLIYVPLPQISMTMIDGTIVKWLKAVGDPVVAGEPLVEIQTDKVVEELAASASGVLYGIAAPEGEVVAVGSVICTIVPEGAASSAAGAAAPAAAPLPESPAAAVPQVLADRGSKGRISASPLAKKIALQKGVDLASVPGTGPGGMIVKADVEHLAAAPAAPSARPAAPVASTERAAAPALASAAEDTVVPFEGIRRAIADNLMLSKRSAAEVTTVADADMGAIKAMRQVLPVSYTVFSILAAAKALQEYPIMNALVEADRVIMKRQINVCVAVATKLGLLTPVIPNVGGKNLLTIADDLADLSERGREGKLAARDFDGGTFTVTNSGVFGSVIFTPILNHPQSAVLGLGRIVPTPVVRDDAIVPALMMYMSLTYNHRSIDGETAVKFLQRVRYYLEHPKEMLGLQKH